MTTVTTRKLKKKIEYIQLKKVGHSVRDLSEFQKKLIDGLGDDIFHFETQNDLLFNLLKQISPINKTLKNDENSIEKACERVVKHFSLDTEVKMGTSTDTGWKEIKIEETSNTEKFCQFIIGIDKIPAVYYHALLDEVNKDLVLISKLIAWYETQPCIQKYKNNNEIPKSHDDRIVYDFYQRCLTERIEILNYYLNGVKKRAIEKSRYIHEWMAAFMSITERFYDRPYHFSRPFSIHFFDCRQIDLAGHRIDEYQVEPGRVMQRLYNDDKAKFYRLYFKKNSALQYFQNFNFYLSYLPLSKNRKPIFDELIRLFKARRWISFYALALPQVEGLFSEMCLAISPEKDLSQKSLPHKVKSVRPFHFLSTTYFDYFEYYIPLQRNKFSHTGYDEDFKLKSYDLLVDLSHLLKIFYELDNPLVKIKKLHTRKNFEDFISIKEFADYFNLLNAVKPSQMKEIQMHVDEFEKQFLSQDCNVEYTCYEMMQELSKIAQEFVESINRTYKSRHSKIEFDKLNKPQIEKLLEDTQHFETMKDCFTYNNDNIEKLGDLLYFHVKSKKVFTLITS